MRDNCMHECFHVADTYSWISWPRALLPGRVDEDQWHLLCLFLAQPPKGPAYLPRDFQTQEHSKPARSGLIHLQAGSKFQGSGLDWH